MDFGTSSQISLFCSTCKMHLQDQEAHKKHYKEDIHRYNSKRKIVNLPHISQEEFTLHQAEIAKKQQLADRSQGSIDLNRYCECCRKQINSDNAFKQHLESKKHKENEKMFKAKQKNQSEATVDTDDVSSSDGSMVKHITTIDSKKACLFCNHEHKTIKKNLDHMRTKHSFFIPAIEFICDVKGILHYLAEKINTELLCIYCDNKGCKGFKTSLAVQAHMMDKGHCMLATLDNEEEFADFYDFTSTYPQELQDQLKEREEMAETREEIKLKEGSDNEFIDEDDDDEWENIDTPEIQSHTFSEIHSTIDGGDDVLLSKSVPYNKYNVQMSLTNSEREIGGEVRLPNGKLIGNRDLKAAYKQNVNPQDSREMVMINRVAAQYRQLNVVQHGWNLEKFREACEKRVPLKETKVSERQYLGLGVKANKFQVHDRVAL